MYNHVNFGASPYGAHPSKEKQIIQAWSTTIENKLLNFHFLISNFSDQFLAIIAF